MLQCIHINSGGIFARYARKRQG